MGTADPLASIVVADRLHVTSLADTLTRIAQDLTEARVGFALIGGLAVSVRTEPRFTRDADLAVAVADDIEAETLIDRLRVSGYGIGTVLEQQAVGRLSTVRLLPTDRLDDQPVVDLLFASSGIEPEIVRDAEPLEVLPSVIVPVARTAHLLALKLLSRNDTERPQDLIDLRALLGVATPDDIARARECAAMIEARGYHRGRNLLSDLNALLAP
jgi:hypothetical protein